MQYNAVYCQTGMSHLSSPLVGINPR